MVAAVKPNWERFPASQDQVRSKSASGCARLSLVEQTAQKTLSRVRHPAGTNLSSQTVTALSLTDLSACLSRHILQLTPSIGPHHPVVNGLDCVSSGIGLLIGSAVTVGHGIADLNKSQTIGDTEGVQRAGTQIASGAVSTNAAALSLASATTVSLYGLGVAADIFWGVGSVLNLGISGWGIYRAARFRSRIDNYLDSKKLNERERIVKTLEFLKEKVTPTDKEKEAIVREVERLHPKWGPQETLREIKRKVLDLGEVKIRYFKRRTCQSTAEKVLLQVDKHLNRLRRPDCDLAHLAEAKKLIHEVKKQNENKILLSAVILITSLISFTALIIGTFFSLGILPFALYAISSAIALGILLYPLITDNLWKSQSAAIQSRAIALAPLTILTTNQ